jgi:hypothetical protein
MRCQAPAAWTGSAPPGQWIVAEKRQAQFWLRFLALLFSSIVL